jgi:hypothetical protein
VRRAALVALLLLLTVALPVAAQTATPTPSPTTQVTPQFGLPNVIVVTALPPPGTLTPIPPTMTPADFSDLEALFDFPTPTPFPAARATLLAVIPDMTPGGAFVPPPLPDLGDTRFDTTAPGFTAISDWNIARLMDYLSLVAILFWAWLVANFPQLVAASRWFVIILMVLYGIYRVWRGSGYVPPDQEPPSFARTFRDGGRYFYYTRGYRERMREARTERLSRGSTTYRVIREAPALPAGRRRRR